ncbi:hypothetical protein AJ80_03518 [Polytolypa hystricis UAMH7299]|uniref:F-box domain-containing protein n=1 Tax=Polytolypa hystricis (strain UAMH7299) TaxID=1447883 RepID=A0A2B7YIR9_POLH7|nr:hypothetical protein AJ80_03518 [Polytolypa hystricis UAMH7299]
MAIADSNSFPTLILSADTMYQHPLKFIVEMPSKALLHPYRVIFLRNYAGEKILAVSHRIKRRVTRWKQKGQPNQPQKPPSLLNLPVEILFLINDFLPALSQACLALTCKDLYKWRRERLFTRPLQPPYPSYKDGLASLFSKRFWFPRWQLLLLLENDRWQCCSTCFRLHPPNAFSKSALLKEPHRRTCILGPDAGLVWLCPGCHITFRDKLRIISNWLSSTGKLNSGYGCAIIYGQVRVSTTHHSCVEPKNNYELSIHTGYTIKTESPGTLAQSLYTIPQVLCPHISIYTYLQDVLRGSRREDYSNLPVTAYGREVICKWCDTSIQYIDYQSEQGLLRLKTIRRLGGATFHVDATWESQTAYPLRSSSDYSGDNLKERPFGGTLETFVRDKYDSQASE